MGSRSEFKLSLRWVSVLVFVLVGSVNVGGCSRSDSGDSEPAQINPVVETGTGETSPATASTPLAVETSSDPVVEASPTPSVTPTLAAPLLSIVGPSLLTHSSRQDSWFPTLASELFLNEINRLQLRLDSRSRSSIDQELALLGCNELVGATASERDECLGRIAADLGVQQFVFFQLYRPRLSSIRIGRHARYGALRIRVTFYQSGDQPVTREIDQGSIPAITSNRRRTREDYSRLFQRVMEQLVAESPELRSLRMSEEEIAAAAAQSNTP